MEKHFLKFYLYGSLGFTTEMVFTAFHDMAHRFTLNLPFEFALKGNSFLWMFLIYGSGAFLFPFAHQYISKYNFWVRLFLMAIGIFAVEFITGFLLDMLTGSCPWEYHAKLSVLGYIRLDYLPAWMFFGFLLEKADALFNKMLQNF